MCYNAPKQGFHAPADQTLQRGNIRLCERKGIKQGCAFFCVGIGVGCTRNLFVTSKAFQGDSVRKIRISEWRELSAPKGSVMSDDISLHHFPIKGCINGVHRKMNTVGV